MIFAREQLLLNLLDALGGEAGNLDFQKLLLLYTREFETVPSYEFIPYKFGCFSFSSYADKRRLVKQGLLTEEEQKWQLTDAGRAALRKTKEQWQSMDLFCRRYGKLRGTPLIALTYRRFPYFATRSEILRNVLPNPDEREMVNAARPARRGAGLFTIGYEGKSLEAYLNQLLQASVTILCDVRRNPLSRKYGFSKNTLAKGCEGVGIRYEHIPELGIASEARRGLATQADYEALFTDYKRRSLPRLKNTLAKIRSWVKKGECVALTCFERFPAQCHRHCIAEALERSLGRRFTPLHL